VTVVVPDPVPLDMPPGDAEALAEVVSDVAGAGFHLTVMSRRLAGPAAAAPGWLGADAAAAAAQVGTVAALAEEVCRAALTAVHRLGDHAERLRDARRQVSVLRREQEDDFGAVWARLDLLGDLDLAMTTDMPEAVAVVEELRGSEDSRRRRHAALLEEIDDDAAATGRVLVDCCGVVGGRAVPGDASRVVTYLAARLPGWGDAELAARGRAFAEEVMGGRWNSRDLEVAARDAVLLARTPAFATALIAGLGVDGVGALLVALGADVHGDSSAVARTLAASLGAATRSSGGHDTVEAVLGATFVRPGFHGESSDTVAAGMATLLLAAVPGTPGGLRTETVVQWARQMLRRERAEGVFAGAGAVPQNWDRRLWDPAALAVDAIVASGDPGHAAGLLADRGTWDDLLARAWGDAEGSLGGLVASAASEPGQAGAGAMRAGLEAWAAGLADGGDPDGWTVHRATAAAVAPSLAAGLAVHRAVVPEILGPGAAGSADAAQTDALRGLARLTVDRAAALVVEQGLCDWAAAERRADGTGLRSAVPPAVALTAAYLAVQEYGQRLDHAHRAYELQEEAETRSFVWKFSPLHLLTFAPGPWGMGAGVVEPFVARLLETDGTWEIGPDLGRALDADDAVRGALAHLPAGSTDHSVVSTARVAREAFDGMTRTLGHLAPPEAPGRHWWDPVLEAAESLAVGRFESAVEARRLTGK
jgi:hypothetical protein